MQPSSPTTKELHGLPLGTSSPATKELHASGVGWPGIPGLAESTQMSFSILSKNPPES